MTPLQTLAVTIRCFTLWLFLYSATIIFSNYFYAKEHVGNFSLLTPFISLLFVSIVCILLWKFPLFISKKILPTTHEASNSSPLFESWFTVGSSLVGLFALSKSIPALAGYFIQHYLAFKLYPTTFQANPDWPLHVAFNIFQVVFGLWLFLGGKGLKKILMWARHA